MSTSCNAFSQGETGNVITDRPTSRVLAPPGGGSSLGSLLAWDEPAKNKEDVVVEMVAPAGKAPAPPPDGPPWATKVPMPQGDDAPAARAAPVPAAPVPRPRVEAFETEAPAAPARPLAFGANTRHGSNAFANGASQNTGNVLTDRSTTRLHAPPGGHSTLKLW